MAQLISEIWAGLRDAGLPEVMLYLPDNSASRCHWNDTALVGETRVALLADQDRQIVRIFPVDACVGIGIASPKGVDPSGYRRFVQVKLQPDLEVEAEDAPADEPASVGISPAPPPPEPAPAPEPLAEKPDPLTSRWGVSMKSPTRFGAPATASPARR
jgi:hypothetical protein